MISDNDRNMLIQIMLFYSFLTFFISPAIGFYTTNNKQGITYGMIAGMILSLLLWSNYGYDMIKNE